MSRKKKQKLVTGIQCPVCEEKIWSRFTHDFRNCECGYSAIDGGNSYLRVSYGSGNWYTGSYEEFLGEIDVANEITSYIGIPKEVRILVDSTQVF